MSEAKIQTSRREAYVVSPADGIEGDRVDVLVENERERDGEVENGETLGTEREGQDFNGVGDDKRGEGNTMDEAISSMWYHQSRGVTHS